MKHEENKAVVFYEESAVKVPFRNFSSSGVSNAPTLSNEEIYGFLVVFNSFDELLDPTQQKNVDVQKLIDGLASEISVAYVNGWKVIYYTTFKKYVNCGENDLPKEFTVSEDDMFYNKTNRKDMAGFIHHYLPYLQVVRFTGIISDKEFEQITKLIQKDELKLETDSPYLIVV